MRLCWVMKQMIVLSFKDQPKITNGGIPFDHSILNHLRMFLSTQVHVGRLSASKHGNPRISRLGSKQKCHGQKTRVEFLSADRMPMEWYIFFTSATYCVWNSAIYLSDLDVVREMVCLALIRCMCSFVFATFEMDLLEGTFGSVMR